MKILASFLLFGLSVSLYSQDLEITYIANEGVLIKKDNSKVLIDALFDGYFDGYTHPNADLRNDMTEGESPYDNIDLVLTTHRHRDHFETQVTGNFLLSHTESTFLSNYQVADSLRIDYENYTSISSRVIGKDRSLVILENEIAGIKVYSFFIEHAGGRRDPPAENLAFIVDLNGTKVLHLGDSDMDFDRFEQLDLANFDIDVALIPYWYMTDQSGRDIIELIEPKNLIGIHYPKAPSRMALQEIKKHYPQATVFQEQFEKLKY